MKIKIIQYYVGKDKKYLQLCEIVESLNSKYAQLYNYQYKFLYLQHIKKERNENSSLHQSGYKLKIQLIKQHLLNCDYLVFIDADAIISNPNIKIQDLIDTQHQFFLSQGNTKFDFLTDFSNLCKAINFCLQNQENILNNWSSFCKNQRTYKLYQTLEKMSLGNRYFNEGFFIIKNTPKMKNFFNLCYKNIQLFKTKRTSLMGNDGRCISFFLQQQQFNNIDTMLPSFVQRTYFWSL